MIAVLGQRGTGKTTWIFKNLDSFAPFVLIDPLYDPKFKKVDLHHLENIADAVPLFRDKDPRRIYASPNLSAFDFLCGCVLARGDMTLIVDEVDFYCTSWYISGNFKKVIDIGRHKNVNLIALCRRPKNMNPRIRAQATRFIVFPIGGEDAKDLDSYLGRGFNAHIEKLKTNGNGSQYIEYDFKTKNYSLKHLTYVAV